MLTRGLGLPLTFALALSAGDLLAKPQSHIGSNDPLWHGTLRDLLPAGKVSEPAQTGTAQPENGQAVHRVAQGCSSCCWRRC